MSETLRRLSEVIESRKPANGGDPAKSYVAKLFTKGDDAILKKIGEEATETDLWFHTMVLLAQFDLKPQDVLNELARREGMSGLEEKAARPS
jgi:phosphoribosyl-ATP pyrophosphohydrolase